MHERTETCSLFALTYMVCRRAQTAPKYGSSGTKKPKFSRSDSRRRHRWPRKTDQNDVSESYQSFAQLLEEMGASTDAHGQRLQRRHSIPPCQQASLAAELHRAKCGAC